MAGRIWSRLPLPFDFKVISYSVAPPLNTKLYIIIAIFLTFKIIVNFLK